MTTPERRELEQLIYDGRIGKHKTSRDQEKDMQLERMLQLTSKEKLERSAVALAARQGEVEALAFKHQETWSPGGENPGFYTLLMSREPDMLFIQGPNTQIFDPLVDAAEFEYSKGGTLTGKSVGVNTDTYLALDYLVAAPDLVTEETARTYFFVDNMGKHVKVSPFATDIRARHPAIIPGFDKPMFFSDMSESDFKDVNGIFDQIEASFRKVTNPA